MASVLEIAKKMNKEFKNDSLAIKADVQPHYKRCAMGMLGFDYPLFGGLPEGRVIQMSGKESSGKTTAACAFMAAYQRKYPEKTCVFVDVEHALDLEWVAQATELDMTKLVYVNPENMSGEQILDLAAELLQGEDIGCMTLDSVAALAPGEIYENDIDKGSFANIAKSLGRFFTKTLDKISALKSILIIINQVRPVFGARVPTFAEPCGKALAYYTSILLRFGTRTYTHGDQVDSREGEKADGIRLWFEIRKNKTATVQRGGGWITIRYDTGLDQMKDLLDVALKYEFIQRPTSQRYRLIDLNTGEVYSWKDTISDNGTIGDPDDPLDFVGRGKVLEFFNTHPNFRKRYVDMVTEFISQKQNQCGSLLDENMLASMREESAKIEKNSGYED